MPEPVWRVHKNHVYHTYLRKLVSLDLEYFVFECWYAYAFVHIHTYNQSYMNIVDVIDVYIVYYVSITSTILQRELYNL